MFYSIIVRFQAKEDIYFKYYPAEDWHGMLFNVMKIRDKEKTTVLHDDFQSKPFTISPIIPYLNWKEGERLLKAGRKHFVRVTFLEEEWYQLFMEYFLFNPGNLKLNGGKIEVLEVLTNSKEHKKCKNVKPVELRKNARKKQKIKLKFHSTTTFRVNKRHIIFPQAKYLFNSLLSKWKEFTDIKLEVTSKDFARINISRYELESAMEQFKGYPMKGFRGFCEYELGYDLSDENVKDINLLADFAFYGGVGYKTTMGLGQVARV